MSLAITKYSNKITTQDAYTYWYHIMCCCLKEYMDMFVDTDRDYFTDKELVEAKKLYKRLSAIDPTTFSEEMEQRWDDATDVLHEFVKTVDGDNRHRVSVLCGTMIMLLDRCEPILKSIQNAMTQEMFNAKMDKALRDFDKKMSKKLDKATKPKHFKRLKEEEHEYIKSLESVRIRNENNIGSITDNDFIEFRNTLIALSDEGTDSSDLYEIIKSKG